MKRRNKEDYILFILFLILTIGINIFNIKINNIIRNEKEFNDLLKYKCVEMNVKSNKFIKELIKIKEHFTLLENDYEGVYGVYINQETSYELPLIWGRFIDKNDCKNNERLIVLGKNYQNRIIEKDNMKFYLINNEYYQVVGVMGDNYRNTIYDNLLFYSIDINKNIINEKNYYSDNILNNNVKGLLKKYKIKYKINSQNNSSINIWEIIVSEKTYILLIYVLISIIYFGIENYIILNMDNCNKEQLLKKIFFVINLGAITGSLIVFVVNYYIYRTIIFFALIINIIILNLLGLLFMINRIKKINKLSKCNVRENEL